MGHALANAVLKDNLMVQWNDNPMVEWNDAGIHSVGTSDLKFSVITGYINIPPPSRLATQDQDYRNLSPTVDCVCLCQCKVVMRPCLDSIDLLPEKKIIQSVTSFSSLDQMTPNSASFIHTF